MRLRRPASRLTTLAKFMFCSGMTAMPFRLALLLTATLGVVGCEQKSSVVAAPEKAAPPLSSPPSAPPKLWGPAEPGSEPPGGVTIPWKAPPYQRPPPRAPASLTRQSDKAQYAFQDSKVFQRMGRDLRAYFGNRRESYYTTNGLLSRQVNEGFSGYNELLTTSDGRRLYWGYRLHAGPTQYAVLYGRGGTIQAVAVRDWLGYGTPRLSIYLRGSDPGRAEVAIFRDWSLYMTAYRGQEESVASVRIIRLRKP